MGTPHTGPGRARRDMQHGKAGLWSSHRNSGACSLHWSHLLCRLSDVQKGPSGPVRGTCLTHDECAGGRGRAQGLCAAAAQRGQVSKPAATAGLGTPLGRIGPGRRSLGAPSIHWTPGAPGCGPTQLGLRTACLVLPRRSRAPGAPPRYTAPGLRGSSKGGRGSLIPRSGSSPQFPLWLERVSGRPRGLPRPRGALARSSHGDSALSRPPGLRLWGLEGGRPNPARRPPRARDRGGRSSGTARWPRSSGSGPGRCPARAGPSGRSSPPGAGGPGPLPAGLGCQEPSGASDRAVSGRWWGRGGAGPARPVRCPGPGGGPRKDVPSCTAPSRPHKSALVLAP